MIPIKLTITGFLSYQETTELDFTQFDLACISGPNGAGKSSLLDAFTWVLFGQEHANATRSSSTCIQMSPRLPLYLHTKVIPTACSAPCRKARQPYWNSRSVHPSDGKWRALSGATLRNTQELIEHTLRLDYETFVNASFFLQGKADQFTQQKPGDRKRILGSILGLEVWETYKLPRD